MYICIYICIYVCSRLLCITYFFGEKNSEKMLCHAGAMALFVRGTSSPREHLTRICHGGHVFSKTDVESPHKISFSKYILIHMEYISDISYSIYS